MRVRREYSCISVSSKAIKYAKTSCSFAKSIKKSHDLTFFAVLQIAICPVRAFAFLFLSPTTTLTNISKYLYFFKNSAPTVLKRYSQHCRSPVEGWWWPTVELYRPLPVRWGDFFKNLLRQIERANYLWQILPQSLTIHLFHYIYVYFVWYNGKGKLHKFWRAWA